MVHTVVQVLDKNNQAIGIFVVTKDGDVHIKAVDSTKANIIIYGSEVETKR